MIYYELSVIQSKDTKVWTQNTPRTVNQPVQRPKGDKNLRPLNIVCNTRLMVCYLLVMLVLGTRLHCGYGVWSGILKRAGNQLCFQAFKHYETTIKDTNKTFFSRTHGSLLILEALLSEENQAKQPKSNSIQNEQKNHFPGICIHGFHCHNTWYVLRIFGSFVAFMCCL